MRFTFTLLLVLASAYSTPAYSEGAIVVGDGGHTISCKGRPPVFYDLFEYLWFNKDVQLKPVGRAGQRGFYLNRIYKEALRQLALDEGRQATLKTTMNNLDEQIEKANEFPILDHEVQLVYRNFVVHPEIADYMQQNDCKATGLIMQPLASDFINIKCEPFHNLIPGSCFLINRSLIGSLNGFDQACLILHEGLRKIMTSVEVEEQNNLRYWTGRICSSAWKKE